MRPVAVVAVVLAAVLGLSECQSGRRAVGEGCAKDEDCMPGALCLGTNKQCTCPSGYGHVADFSRCLNVSQQMITNAACKNNDDCSTKVKGSTRCLVLSFGTSMCICDPHYLLSRSNDSCLLSCTSHVFCAQHDASTVCVDGSTTADAAADSKYCGVVTCETDANCSHIEGAQCQAVRSSPDTKSCQVKPPSNGEGGNDTSDKTQLEKDFELYMLIALGGVGGGIVITTMTVVLIVSGECSGDIAAKSIRGRGVPMIQKRLPLFIGGSRLGPGVAVRRPSAFRQPVAVRRSPSAGNARIIPVDSRSSVSFGVPSSSVVGSSVYESSVIAPTSEISVMSGSSMGSSMVDSSVISRGQRVVYV